MLPGPFLELGWKRLPGTWHLAPALYIQDTSWIAISIHQDEGGNLTTIRKRAENPGASPGKGKADRDHPPAVHVSYNLVKKGVTVFLEYPQAGSEAFGPAVGVSVGTGKRIATTLKNLRLAQQDASTGKYSLTDSGTAFAATIGTREEERQIRVALDRLPEFVMFWDRVATRHRRPDTALLKEVLQSDYNAAPKAAFNLASTLMGYVKAAGYVGSESTGSTISANKSARSPLPQRSTPRIRPSAEPSAHRIYVLMALAQSAPGKSGELPHKVEIQNLLGHGPLLPRGTTERGLGPKAASALEETLRLQLRKALDANSKVGIAAILEILEALTRGAVSEGGQ
jgi:hypothetical protein